MKTLCCTQGLYLQWLCRYFYSKKKFLSGLILDQASQGLEIDYLSIGTRLLNKSSSAYLWQWCFLYAPINFFFPSPEHAEADTFFCFTNLMAEIRDNFIKSLDDSQCGITYKMEKVYSTLKEKDVELYLKLVRS